jgi:cell growth-regulating nucleolar protein
VQDNGDDEWESDEDDMHAEYDRAQRVYAAHGYEYGSYPVPAAYERFDSVPDLKRANGDFITPDPRRSHARKISTDSTGQKKSGKRKRGHPEDLDLSKINTDVVMTDVGPPMHSGLTGGIGRLMTQRLPPSPDESPNSPIKRSRRDDKDRKDKAGRRKSSDSDKADRKRAKRHQEQTSTKNPLANSKHHPTTTSTTKPHATPAASKRRLLKRSPSPTAGARKKPALKAIEYPSPRDSLSSKQDENDNSMALVRISHAPTTKPVASFLDCLAKGTDTEEGVSVWKALKRWRKDAPPAAGKKEEEGREKELWKGIKIRMNDRGELIICV